MTVTALSQSAICEHLPDYFKQLVEQWHILPSVGSTNQYISELSASCAVCLAEAQLQGRGRHGRSWIASSHRNVMLSLSWNFPRWPSQLSILSLGAATAVTKALQGFEIETTIKWPNDIYLNNVKLGGLLLEAHGNQPDSCQIVIGLGLNVHITDEDAPFIDQPWTDLHSGFPNWPTMDVDRNQLAAAILHQWLILLTNFPTNQDKIIERWHQYALYLNQPVLLLNKENQSLQDKGIMRGVNQEGHLLIESSSGAINQYADSNLSLRPDLTDQ